MYEAIRDWEMDAGEDFFDYFESSINEYNLLFWAMGKGYITQEDIQQYENRGRHSSVSEIVMGDEPYSITKFDDDAPHDEMYITAYMRVAEFLASTTTYQKRVGDFINNIHDIKLEDVVRNMFRERVFFFDNGERVYVKSDDVVQFPIVKLLSTQWYVDNNELED